MPNCWQYNSTGPEKKKNHYIILKSKLGRSSYENVYIIYLANKASRQKNEYFKVRLTVSSDPPPYGQLFVIFLGVLLTLYYDYMCS